jgi:hypothetical protein
MSPLTFPVWGYVNAITHPEEGYPFYLMVRGGEGTPMPAHVVIFSTKEIAMSVVGESMPFVLVELDRGIFCEALQGCRYVDEVLLDMGTKNATIYRAEELLIKLCNC